MKIIGLRSNLGKGLIGNAINTFETIATKLKTGIEHCQADINAHQIDISAKQDKIRELNGHIEKGNRVLAKVQDLLK